MLLTITTTNQPATDLGFLLHKHPDRLNTLSLPFGEAHVFFPEMTEERCTAALLINVDPIKLVRKGRRNENFALAEYVNDRPYVASSLMSVALNQAFRTTLSGQCKQHPELVKKDLPIEVRIAVLPCHGGETILKKVFHPLGYEIEAKNHTLDEDFPDWGESRYYTVTLRRTCPLKEFLNHLYVLIPVLDNNKHYYIDKEEIEKLLRCGEGWLEKHPEKEMITYRYLQFRRIAEEALSRISDAEHIHTGEEKLQEEKRILLNEQRMQAVFKQLKATHAKRVLDLGCGEGKLLKKILDDGDFEQITGVDVSSQALQRAQTKLRLDHLPSSQRKRISLFQTALTYRDQRLSGYDAAAIVEVIEHLDLSKLDAFKRVVFEFARPNVVIITTPNADYNTLYEALSEGEFRHSDHRFEWTRQEFEKWSQAVAETFHYSVCFEPIGEVHEKYGGPTQMGVFKKLT
ncbi:MAG: Ubiquinone biosynthesis O-methyltransferase [Chlamydiae bacterium]|nr:Ubiquinone biosynthesis O-methyltransferase [Chlamydiota bacterium]